MIQGITVLINKSNNTMNRENIELSQCNLPICISFEKIYGRWGVHSQVGDRFES